MRRCIPRLFLLLAAVVLLHGCSAVRLGYGNADSLARWWIDQYVDLSPEQNALVQERLARLQAWHRRTQLPDYVALTRAGQQFVDARPSAADALALGDELLRRARTLAEQAIPDVADFLPTLGVAQIERMERRFAAKNADHAKEIRLAEGEAGQRRARYKRVLDRAEYWLGDLSEAQAASLRQRIDAQPSGAQFWFDERQRRQREWLALVRQVQGERLPRDRVIALLRDYAARFDLPVDAGRQAQARALRRNTAELAAAIVAMATPEQRAHARYKLSDLGNDFDDLAREVVAGGSVPGGN